MSEIKDKIALIFHGKIGGMTGHNGLGQLIDYEVCAKTIKHNIMSHYDCDVFMHSWDVQYEEQLKKIYNPKYSLFQEQEYFGFTPEQLSQPRRDPIQDAGSLHQAFRTISRFTSLQRAMNLKKRYEEENDFLYKWVIIMRYDLIIFHKLDLSNKDENLIYSDYDPNWKWFQGIIFMGNSKLMDEFGDTINEINIGKYNPSDIHGVEGNKIRNMFNHDESKFRHYIFKRFEGIEIYRQVMQPTTCLPRGDSYGALEMPRRLNELLQAIQ